MTYLLIHLQLLFSYFSTSTKYRAHPWQKSAETGETSRSRPERSDYSGWVSVCFLLAVDSLPLCSYYDKRNESM